MQELLDVYNKTKYLYDKIYDIHICKKDEINDVVNFIDEYWQSGHIFTKSRKLLDWQHWDSENNRYNFVIARNKENGQIHGLLGFILSSVYDSQIATPIRWGAIWKVREDVAIKGLGLILKGYLEKEIPTPFIGGVGLSEYSKKINTKLGERMGKLAQYYIVNPDIKEYKIIVNPSMPEIIGTETCIKYFCNLTPDIFRKKAKELQKFIMPYKSITYYINRYFNHPLYQYFCMEIDNEQHACEAIVFWRKCTVEEAANLFIVDYIGEGKALQGTYHLFIELLRKERAECISFPFDGFSQKDMEAAGFLLRDKTQITLPVYYEPFVRQNVDLDFHFYPNSCNDHILIVKGDADQDRPNRLSEVADD